VGPIFELFAPLVATLLLIAGLRDDPEASEDGDRTLGEVAVPADAELDWCDNAPDFETTELV